MGHGILLSSIISVYSCAIQSRQSTAAGSWSSSVHEYMHCCNCVVHSGALSRLKEPQIQFTKWWREARTSQDFFFFISQIRVYQSIVNNDHLIWSSITVHRYFLKEMWATKEGCVLFHQECYENYLGTESLYPFLIKVSNNYSIEPSEYVSIYLYQSWC